MYKVAVDLFQQLLLRSNLSSSYREHFRLLCHIGTQLQAITIVAAHSPSRYTWSGSYFIIWAMFCAQRTIWGMYKDLAMLCMYKLRALMRSSSPTGGLSRLYVGIVSKQMIIHWPRRWYQKVPLVCPHLALHTKEGTFFIPIRSTIEHIPRLLRDRRTGEWSVDASKQSIERHCSIYNWPLMASFELLLWSIVQKS
jgi:hypothetical protein